jgi:phenylacetic acid degradation operon negative regulatory protein
MPSRPRPALSKRPSNPPSRRVAAKKGFVDAWVQGYLRQEAPRSKSLMISAFGDSVAPYADGIWLGDFIELMAPLGLNERLVRTSAFRLIEEGWLQARREGRRSHYSLTTDGVRRFEAAYKHIYQPPQESWDGTWTTVLLPRQGLAPADRAAELKRELEWEGFAANLPGAWLHPGVPAAQVQAIVDRLGLREHVGVLESRAWSRTTQTSSDELLRRLWNLEAVEARYQEFLIRFGPLLSELSTRSLSPAQAFQIQTLLMHSFRRTSLHDPRLPQPMLPADWSGLRAFRLCRDLYTRTYRLTREHLQSLRGLEISNSRGARLRMEVEQRFGGLQSVQPLTA